MCNLACIEIIMQLEDKQLEDEVLDNSELLVACYFIIESAVSYMAGSTSQVHVWNRRTAWLQTKLHQRYGPNFSSCNWRYYWFFSSVHPSKCWTASRGVSCMPRWRTPLGRFSSSSTTSQQTHSKTTHSDCRMTPRQNTSFAPQSGREELEYVKDAVFPQTKLARVSKTSIFSRTPWFFI